MLAAVCASFVVHAHEERPGAASPLTKNAPMPAIRPAPALELGGFELSRLRGRPVLVAFVYTSCTSACPLLSARMARLERKLDAAHVAAELVSVTVDPERDDAKKLALYAKGFGAGPRWRFVRDEPARTARTLAPWDEWTKRLPSGEIDHPARVHLVDAQGRVREIYSLAFFDEDQAFLDIMALQDRGQTPARKKQ